MEIRTYWNNQGKYQYIYQELRHLIPDKGKVESPRKNKALEKLRVAMNCYYDLNNNGLDNLASQFRVTFGFGGRAYARADFRDEKITEAIELKLDEIIINAFLEQLPRYKVMIKMIKED